MPFCAVIFQNSKSSQAARPRPHGESQHQLRTQMQTQMPNLSLRRGDRARVRFRFMFYAEYVEPGAVFVFRDGRAKGLGRVKEVYCGT
jgi:GTPase